MCFTLLFVEVKGLEDQLLLVKALNHDERIDSYWEYYRPFELTVLEEQFSFNMPNSIRFVQTTVEIIDRCNRWSVYYLQSMGLLRKHNCCIVCQATVVFLRF